MMDAAEFKWGSAFLNSEKHPLDVDVENPPEIVFGDLFEWSKLRNSRIGDNNIDLAKRLRCLVKQASKIIVFADIRSDGDGIKPKPLW
jgi:hypothetical protein